MPRITANNCEMSYELDDFSDPWRQSETIWIQHGFGRNLRFWQHWVPLLAGHLRVLRRDMRGHGDPPIRDRIINGQRKNCCST